MRYLFYLLFALSFFSVSAQLESYNWYFGRNSGISFLPSGVPSAVSNSAMNARFGSASISDSCTGQLWFYTEGDTVWNRNHQYMLNGTGLGGLNSTQSSLVVGKPSSSDGEYYVFTVGTTLNSGLSYSIIDMNLDNGLGAVIPGKKKISLVNSTLEKITAVRHSNNMDIWIVTHTLGDNNFYAFLLSNTSISAPVISQVGPVYTTNDLKGYMKASPDGSMLCLALEASKRFDLFDFDINTGIVSNPRSSPSVYPFAFGVEFSPDASKLYVTSDPDGLFQYDLSTANAGLPLGISTFISNTGQIKALQLGPDKKIYVNEAFTLGVINDPNVAGLACNYQAGLIPLSGFGNNALPSFMQSYFTPPFIVEKNLCLGIATEFSISINSNVDSLLWDFGEPSSGLNNTSKALNPTHLFADTGFYTITSHVYSKKCGVIRVDTVTRQIEIISRPIPIVELGNDTIICEGDSILLWTNGVEPNYYWSNGSNASQIVVYDEGTYWVSASNECGAVRDTITIKYFNSQLNLDLGKDTNICDGDNYTLNATQNGALSYTWSTTSVYPRILIEQPGEYWVSVSDLCSSQSDTVVIGLKYRPSFDLGNDTIICDGEVYLLDVSYPNASYEWQDGSSRPFYPVKTEGYYFVNVENACGNTRREVYIRIKDCSCHIHIPNSFTPNSDQINDEFRIYAECSFKKFELTIFNRWGEIVYNTKNPDASWNGAVRGKNAESGSFTYKIIYQSNDPFDQEEHEILGGLTLIK